MNQSILIVDDSKFSRTMLLRPLLNAGYDVTGCASPVEAVDLIKANKPDVIISDLRMPTLIDGLGFLKLLGAENPEIPVFVYTADPDPQRVVGETGLERITFVQKPVAADILLQKLEILSAR